VPEKKQSLLKVMLLIAFLVMISAIEFIRMALFITFLPSFLTNLHYNLAILGLVLTLNLLADNLSKSGTGWMVDRFGPWPVLFTGSLLVSIGMVIIKNYYSQTFILFFAAILIGVGASPTWPAVVSGVIRIAGEAKKATMISVISVTWMLGGGLGPVLMGFLIDAGKRASLAKYHLIIRDVYHTGFQILILMAFIALAGSCIGWIGWRRVFQSKQAVAPETEHLSFKIIIQKLMHVWGLIPGMLVQTLSLGMLIPNLLPLVTGKLGMTESQYSLLLIVGGFFVVAFMIPVGHFSDKWGARGFLVAGFLLASIAIFYTATSINRTNIWYVAAVVGCAYALIQPAWNALLAGSIPPSQRGVLMGLFMSVEGLGFAMGPVVGGILGGLKTVIGGLPFYVSSIILFIMAGVYLIYPFHRYQSEV
jgi:MFS family permease